LPVNAVQQRQTILKHLAVLEQRHLGENHLDRKGFRQLDKDIPVLYECPVFLDPGVHVIQLGILLVQLFLKHRRHILEDVHVLDLTILGMRKRICFFLVLIEETWQERVLTPVQLLFLQHGQVLCLLL
jgi:heme exporter protein D